MRQPTYSWVPYARPHTAKREERPFPRPRPVEEIDAWLLPPHEASSAPLSVNSGIEAHW